MKVWDDDAGEDVDVVITGIGVVEWNELLAKHPPRKGETMPWNDDTFPVALVRACTGMPNVAAWWDTAPAAAVEAMFSECLRVSSPGSYDYAVRRLLNNPREHAAVDMAVELQIAPSTFMAWSQEDRDLVMAAASLRASRCPGCGVPDHLRGDGSAFLVTAIECIWCERRETARSRVETEDQGHTHIILKPR